MKRKLKKCLRSQAGETIAEVLVALLVSALALTMLATMITSTVKMVDIGKTKMSQYYDDSKILELQNTPDTVENPLTITIQSEDGSPVSVTETVSNINLYTNSTFSQKVYAYRKSSD